MVDFVDIQFAQLLSGRLEQFRIKATNPYKINFRCPLCGDSQKSRSKARGWLLERDNKFFYYCHNCGSSHSFVNFLKTVDPMTYNDYVAERFIKGKEDKKPQKLNKFTPPKFDQSPLKKIKKISQLKHDHAVKKYIEKRKIPASEHYRLYFAEAFRAWINSIVPNKLELNGKDEPRLVMPFLDEDGKVFGVSARGFNPKGVRYLTIMFEDRPKIFGLDKVDFDRRYFVVEGAIDSLFLDNAVAMAGADGGTKGLRNVENAVFVFDAEPRNREIHKRMEKVIRNGHSICIWPHNVPGKDINEMYMNGMETIEKVISSNIYKGLEASLKLADWRRT